MKRANSGVTWIRQAHVQKFLHQLRALPEISHDTIDALPDSRTREHVRGLLVEHGALPWRTPDAPGSSNGPPTPCNAYQRDPTGTSSTATSAGTCCAA